jgi:hypothetical protein
MVRVDIRFAVKKTTKRFNEKAELSRDTAQEIADRHLAGVGK